MAYQFSADDVRFLTSPDGRAALEAARDRPLAGARFLADLTALRAVAGAHSAAVAETVLLRRKARSRWGDGEIDWGGWLFTDEALQQASPPAVAAHRAARIARRLGSGAEYDAVHDLTCSIGADLAGLSAALAPLGAAVIGSDLDAVRLAMARHNLAAAGLAAQLLRADARTVTSRGTLRYADPARRDAAARRISSADTIPSIADLDAADPTRPPVLRLPPGIDYEALARPGEIEIVSLAGSVREAVAWPEEFATARRRATVLGDDGVREDLTDRDPAEDTVTPASRYLVEPDAAVIRAHLVQQYAARHGLTRLDEHLAYLTGDEPPAGMRAFEILDAAPFAEKTVREWLRRDEVGTLEIKQRGTPVIPDELRRRLKPSGDTRRARTLIVARIGRSTRAFWCRVSGTGGAQHTVA
jgi:hypothetical protein